MKSVYLLQLFGSFLILNGIWGQTNEDTIINAIKSLQRNLTSVVDYIKKQDERIGTYGNRLSILEKKISKILPERVSVLLVGGRNENDDDNTYSAEIATVVKNCIGTFSMTTKKVEPVPQSAPKSLLSSTYMARIGQTQRIFLKVGDSSFIFNARNLSWSTITNAQETPSAYRTPALTFADGFLTFGGHDKDYTDVKLFENNFHSTVVGSFPEYYKPWYTHEVARVNKTTFILAGGRNYGRWAMDGAVMGTLVSGRKVSWTPLKPLNRPRYAHCVLVLNGKVVVVGGYDNHGDKTLQSVEYLDLTSTPLTEQNWKMGPDLPYPIGRITCNVGEEGTFGIIAGGFRDTLLIMEGDLAVHELPTKLTRKRFFHSSAVLKDDY